MIQEKEFKETKEETVETEDAEEMKEEVEEIEVQQETIEEELTAEQLEELERIRIEHEELDQEEGIEFIETINKEDAFQFNIYLQNNPSNFSRRIFTALLGVILIIYILVIKTMYWMIPFGVLIIAYAIFIYGPLQKYLTKRMFDKKDFADLNISIKFGSKIKYELVNEKSALVTYDVIQRVVKTKDYIYLHISAYGIMIIKLQDCSDVEGLVKLLKEKFEPLKRYKEK